MDTTNIFTVTPMAKEIELEAGQTFTGSITVANPANASSDFNYKVEISPYSVIGEEYTADLATESNRSQITNWIKIENPTGTLKPNEATKVKYTITVPESAPAGGQYAALMVSSGGPAPSGSGLVINNVSEMASIIYAKIAGNTVRKGGITEVTIPGFITQMPISIDATIKNEGNSHELANVALEVKSIFSSTPIYPTPEEDGVFTEVIMPETTRHVTHSIGNISPLGIYEVKETINYLGKNTTFSQTVVSCPIWFMILVLVTITAIIVAIIRSIRLHRNRRKVF